MAGRGFRGQDGAFQSKQALEAFTEALNQGKTEAEANAAAQAAQNTITKEGTKAKKDEAKASKGFAQSLKKAAAVAAVGKLAQAGVRASLTSNATFSQGVTDTLGGAFASLTGAALNERAAVNRAAQRTDAFFGDAVRFGGEQPTKVEIQAMFERFKAEEERVIPLQREVGRLGTEARIQATAMFADQAGAEVVKILQDIANQMRSYTGG